MTYAPTRRTALVAGLSLIRLAAAPIKRNLKIAIFSKHLQFISGNELASTAAEIGFNGIDITVRAGGHVDPARAAEELPPLVAIIRQHGLDVPMVTTDIVDAASPNARTVLKTLANLGIRYYRWGGFKYRTDEGFARQLDEFHQRSAQLAALNAEYKVCAIYHTHSGVGLVGAPVWDIFQILKDLDPNAVAINYDVGHATVEGGLGGWIDSFRLAEPRIRGVAFKDFFWQKSPRGNWDPAWVPLGQGMVRFPTFCSLLAKTEFDGPVQLHFEYPLGGADAGKRQLTIGREQVYSAMRRDLERLRSYLSDAGLSNA
ncbi:MAG: TIM barrel protein [Bryobacteraceae bacterium]